MTKVKSILEYLNRWAPVTLKMDFDNVGLLVGNADTKVEKMIIALDITEDVIDEAVASNAQLIVSHHPLFFKLDHITDDDPCGRRIIKLITNNISAICMHTNLDKAEGGVNDALASAVGLNILASLDPEKTALGTETLCGLGRIGELSSEIAMVDYLPKVKEALCSHGLRYYDAGIPVKRVAVLGGSGGDYLEAAYNAGCDTFITADVKYDVFLTAKALSINLIDGDHFCTENVVVKNLYSNLYEQFSKETNIIISSKHGQTTRFF